MVFIDQTFSKIKLCPCLILLSAVWLLTSSNISIAQTSLISDVRASFVRVINYSQCHLSNDTAANTADLVSNGDIDNHFCINKNNPDTIINMNFNNTSGKKLKSILIWNNRYLSANDLNNDNLTPRRLAEFKLRVYYNENGTIKSTNRILFTVPFKSDMNVAHEIELPSFFQKINPTRLEFSAMTNAADTNIKYNNRIMAREIQIRLETIPDPRLTIEKTSSPSGPVAAGDTITYSYIVKNTGNVAISDITLSDSHVAAQISTIIPSDPSIYIDVAPTGDSTDASGDVNWNTLAPGDSIKFKATYTATQEDVDKLQ